VLLKNESAFPWLILVPRRANMQEIYQLNSADQVSLIKEIHHVSKIMQDFFQPQKLNIASLGNIVSQLHIHCVARTKTDSLWPQGIWQPSYQSVSYDESVAKKKVFELKKRLLQVKFD